MQQSSHLENCNIIPKLNPSVYLQIKMSALTTMGGANITARIRMEVIRAAAARATDWEQTNIPATVRGLDIALIHA